MVRGKYRSVMELREDFSSGHFADRWGGIEILDRDLKLQLVQ